MFGGIRIALLFVAGAMAIGCSADGRDSEEEDGSALSWMEDGCSGAPTDSQRCDQGLFWFAKGNRSEQFRSGNRNANFDPAKPTLIYVHGWQADAYKTKSRESFDYKENDPESGIEAITADAWIDAGWNVGLFYWNRLSDEPGTGYFSSPEAAESKIWRTNGPTGMRWRKDDGSFETNDVPTQPAAELFFDVYSAAMRNYRGPEVRIAGHSLGNQMAVRLTALVEDAVEHTQLPRAAMPKRVALLDPYWTKSKAGSKRVGPSRDVRDTVFMLARNGVAIEQYKTSSINDYGLGDDNPFVEENAAYSEFYPNYFPGLSSLLPWNSLRSSHRAAPNLYFWSFAFPPPRECSGKGGPGLSAASRYEDVRSLMGPGRYWVQGGGADTATPSDDCVVLKTDERPKLQPVGLFWTRDRDRTKLHVRVEGPPEAVKARYFVGGHAAGSVDRATGGEGFSLILRDMPTNVSETLIIASLYDAQDRMLGTSENMIDFIDTQSATYIRQYGGMTFEVGFDNAPKNIVRMELDVDGVAVTDSVTGKRHADRTAIRASYEKRDGVKRVFRLRGYDAADVELLSVQRHFVLR